jgi:osmotically-inducible protein OsmY
VRSAETDANHIDVEVQGNKVILKGRVRSWSERQEAERAAWSAPGVVAVEDRI